MPAVLLCASVFASDAWASGPYEIGQVEVDGTICRWTTSVKQHCTRDAVLSKMNALESCYSPRIEKGIQPCRDADCARKTTAKIVSDCCVRTGGEVQ